MLIAVNSFERLEELVLTEWIEDLALSPMVASYFANSTPYDCDKVIIDLGTIADPATVTRPSQNCNIFSSTHSS
jgi:hypothetical protein